MISLLLDGITDAHLFHNQFWCIFVWGNYFNVLTLASLCLPMYSKYDVQPQIAF